MRVVRRLFVSIPFAVLFLAAARPSAAQAQYQRYEGMEVASIGFEPAVQPLEADTLRGALQVKTGQPLRIADVRATIARLFATGRYADIQADVKPGAAGVAVVFLTKNRWFVGGVSIEGAVSSPPNAAQLENAARLDLGVPFSDAHLQEALSGQKRLLESNGLYGASIRPILDYDSGAANQQVGIRLEVESGRRARFGPPALAGDLKLDPSDILNATKLRRWILHTWKPVTQTRTSQALEGIRTLYRKQDRLEAKVSLESIHYDPATNSAIPTIRIDAGPRIRINAIGAKASRAFLQRYVPVFQEHAVDHDLLMEGARNLRDYFQSQGYFEAQAQVEEQKASNDESTIDFLIHTGPRHKLVYIGIGGNKYFGADDLRERMLLRTALFLRFPHGQYSESLLRQDESSISSLYEANGFRDVKVAHRLVDDYLGKKGDLAIFLDINEGPQYFVDSLRVDGVEQLDKAAAVSNLSSAPGQPFSEFSVAVDRDAVLAHYFAKGFGDATFEWSFTPAGKANRVNLRYVVTEGEQQVVRGTVTTGLQTTRASLVNRYVTLRPGDPLSPDAVTEIQRRLYDLGVFAKVDAAIQNPDGDAADKYVLYNVEEAHRYSLAAGFGAQLGRIGGCSLCLDAPAGSTGFSPRVSLDATRNNLWGVAHSISLRTQVSTLDQRAILNYSWPRFEGRDNFNLSFTSLYEQSRDIRTFNSKREEVSGQVSQRLSKATTLFYRFTYRRVAVSDLKVTQYLLNQLSQPVRVGLPSLSLVQDRRDDPVETHRGIYNTLDLGWADHIFGSQPNFVRLLARNATYYPLGKRLALARSTEFGDIHPLRYNGAALDAIPLAERFFGGGGTSDRGFPEYQAGPRDPNSGFPLGGSALLFNQIELRFPLIGENIAGVLFHDAGNVYSSLSKISLRTNQHNLQDFDYMVHAVGAGVRYRTPVGPVRADVGYTVNPPYFFGFKGTEQDLLNAGVDPCPAGVANQCVIQNVSHFQFFISIGQTF
jgi:outer membrane protein assembly complex protein YaeT